MCEEHPYNVDEWAIGITKWKEDPSLMAMHCPECNERFNVIRCNRHGPNSPQAGNVVGVCVKCANVIPLRVSVEFAGQPGQPHGAVAPAMLEAQMPTRVWHWLQRTISSVKTINEEVEIALKMDLPFEHLEAKVVQRLDEDSQRRNAANN